MEWGDISLTALVCEVKTAPFTYYKPWVGAAASAHSKMVYEDLELYQISFDIKIFNQKKNFMINSFLCCSKPPCVINLHVSISYWHQASCFGRTTQCFIAKTQLSYPSFVHHRGTPVVVLFVNTKIKSLCKYSLFHITAGIMNFWRQYV